MLSTIEKELNPNNENANLDALISLAEERGFEIEQNKDTGAGPVDLVFKINIHPSFN